jgi:hypothetical protein
VDDADPHAEHDERDLSRHVGPVRCRDGALAMTTQSERRWTPERRDALALVANGDLEYALRTGSWEPKVGYRRPAFDWLADEGLIEPDYDAAPIGNVLQRVPVHLTDAGREAVIR